MEKLNIKATSAAKSFCTLYSVLAILVSAASWIFNMGWFRVMLTWVLFPLIHAAVLLVINYSVLKYFPYAKALKVYNIIFIVSYVIAYCFFQDFGDIGGAYAFFGFIRDEKHHMLFMVSQWIFGAAAQCHFVMLIVQIVLMVTTKNKLKNQLEEKVNIPS